MKIKLGLIFRIFAVVFIIIVLSFLFEFFVFVKV